MKIRQVNMIECGDWDELVEETYGRPYTFQQQYGCQSRGIYEITIPSDHKDYYTNDTVPEIINGNEMGVNFEAWKARDPKEWNGDPDDNKDWCIELFWRRNFFPDTQMVANDLHAKGLIPAGEYTINIDW